LDGQADRQDPANASCGALLGNGCIRNR